MSWSQQGYQDGGAPPPQQPYQYPQQSFPQDQYYQQPYPPNPQQFPPAQPNAYPQQQQQWPSQQGQLPQYPPGRTPSPYQQPYPQQYAQPTPQQYAQQAPQQYVPQAPQPLLPYTLHFRDTHKHSMNLVPEIPNQPSYEVIYKSSSLSSKPDITITSSTGQTVGTVNFHTWTSKIDLDFPTTGSNFTYKDDFESQHGLGHLYWKLVHSANKHSDPVIKCVDRRGEALATIVLHGADGKIELWSGQVVGRRDAMEEIIVGALSEVEDYRRKLREGQGLNPGVLGAIAAQNAAPPC